MDKLDAGTANEIFDVFVPFLGDLFSMNRMC